MTIPYFDAHCDTGVPVHFAHGSLRRSGFHLDLERLSAFAPCAQVFAVCVYGEDGPDAPGAAAVFQTLLCQLEANRDLVRLCHSAADIHAANAEGKIAALLSMEGADQFGCSLENLRALYDRGLRIVHLTWNHNNALSGVAVRKGGGLTQQGRAFVAAAQDMGVVLDLSHISEPGFWDVLSCAKKPVLAGHSDARALSTEDHGRNLTDDQFRALARQGGVAGLNFCTDFLGLGRDVDAIVAHAEHWLGLGGEKAVCLGGDLDGIEALPKGLTGVQSMDVLYEAMLQKNWSEALVRDIFWNNLMEFMERVL